jgi:hypothetical protein
MVILAPAGNMCTATSHRVCSGYCDKSRDLPKLITIYHANLSLEVESPQ